jgi:tetratricopeptide (TPR) repeat protein
MSRRMKTGTLAVVGLLLGAGLAGCASSKPQFVGPASSSETLRQAMQLAAQAQQHESAGRYEQAIELNRRALDLQPDLAGVWNSLGLSLMGRGRDLDFLEAAQAFKRAADLDPRDERPYQNLGVLYHERGFDEDALEYFSLALERNPNSLESLRGAVASAKNLLRSDEAGLHRLERALMMETSPEWRSIMEFERVRVQQDLAQPRRS